MQTTYRLNTQELNFAFVTSLKTLLPNQEVEITIKTLAPTDLDEQVWLHAMATNPTFDFLHEEAEEIYSLNDGVPITYEV